MHYKTKSLSISGLSPPVRSTPPSVMSTRQRAKHILVLFRHKFSNIVIKVLLPLKRQARRGQGRWSILWQISSADVWPEKVKTFLLAVRI